MQLSGILLIRTKMYCLWKKYKGISPKGETYGSN